MGNLLPEEMWRGCALFWHEHKHRKVIPGEYTIGFNENNDIIANNTREPNKSTSKIGYDFVVVAVFFFCEWNAQQNEPPWITFQGVRSSEPTDRVSHFILSCVVCAFLMPVAIVFYEFIISNLNKSARRQWRCETVFFILNY